MTVALGNGVQGNGQKNLNEENVKKLICLKIINVYFFNFLRAPYKICFIRINDECFNFHFQC